MERGRDYRYAINMGGRRVRSFVNSFARPRGPLLAPPLPPTPVLPRPTVTSDGTRSEKVASKVSGVKKRVERLHDNYRLRQYRLMEGIENGCYEEWEWQMIMEEVSSYRCIHVWMRIGLVEYGRLVIDLLIFDGKCDCWNAIRIVDL